MKRLRLLQIEDSPDDAELVVAELGLSGFAVEAKRVETAAELEAALGSDKWDLVISDYNLPAFSTEGALELLRKRNLDLPFIVVSGCVGEEIAAALMRAGAHDFIVKGNFSRLVPVVERELREAKIRRERQFAQQQLEAKEKLLRDIASSLGEGIMVQDREGRLLFMNPEAERLLGWSELDFMGRDVHDTIHYLHADGRPYPLSECPIYSMLSHGSFFRSEDDVFVRRDGSVFPVSYIVTPILEGNEMVAAVTAFQDISERKQAQEDLRRTTEEVRDLYDNAPCGYHSLDENGNIIRINQTELQWLGYEEDEMLGRNFADLLLPASQQIFRENFPRFKEQGFIYDLDYEMRRKDGTVMSVLLSATAIKDKDGRYLMSRSTVYDVTALKQAENELRESRRQLRELSAFLQNVREEERTRIARELHDELGQALTALRIDLDWLDAKLPKKEAHIENKLALMRNQVASTVESVRRISQDLRPGVLDDLGLAAAIEWQAEQFQQRTGIVCTLVMNREEFELDSPVATSVFRIVQEALTNVARYAEAKDVTITVNEEVQGIQLQVRDDGRGFDATAKPGKKSYGLLGIRERVNMLGGLVKIVSEPGQGTVVWAWIPFEGTGGMQ